MNKLIALACCVMLVSTSMPSRKETRTVGVKVTLQIYDDNSGYIQIGNSRSEIRDAMFTVSTKDKDIGVLFINVDSAQFTVWTLPPKDMEVPEKPLLDITNNLLNNH